MIITPPYALGSAGQLLSGKLLRLSGGAPYRTSAGVQGISGVLYGPAGTMGELTLNSNTSLTINPYRAVVQNSQDATQGQYLVANDAAVTATTATVAGVPTMPTQDASQFRRAYIATYVADAQVAGVASSATTDRAVLDIIPGALAASAAAAAYPAVPSNALLLGELLIPPAGQTVTLTPYNPRTTTRGGILPVIVDGANRSGHDGFAGLYDGEWRDRPGTGLQRWSSARTAWESPGLGYDAPGFRYRKINAQSIATTTFTIVNWDKVDLASGWTYGAGGQSVATCPRDGWYWVHASLDPTVTMGGRSIVSIGKNGVRNYIGGGSAGGNVAEVGAQAFGLVSLVAGDTLYVEAYQDGVGTQTLGNSNYEATVFEAMWQRPN